MVYEIRGFTELQGFSRLVRQGLLSDQMVSRVQADICEGRGETIRGTAGIKKIRCEGQQGGKRGGWRVLFADYPEFNRTYLIWAYPKTSKLGLNAAQIRGLATLKKQLDREVKREHTT